MKERKLFIFCLSFLIVSFIGIHFFGTYSLREVKTPEIEEMIPPGSHVVIAGWLNQKEKASDYQILYLKNVSITYQNQSINESRIIVYNKEKNAELKIGSQIQAEGSLLFFESAYNPGNFDQKFYYCKQNIHTYMWTDSIRKLDSHLTWWDIFRNALLKMRLSWSSYLKETAGNKYGSILSAMLLGEKSSMDAEVKELYQLNGIAHILAISGLHLSFIGHGFYQIIRKGSGSYLAGGIGGLIFMTLYIVMIGVSMSALRAVVMFVLRVMADMSGRVYDPLTAISLAAVMVILWRPLSFYDGGFQLSFGAIIGILFLNPLISRKKKNKNFLYNSIMANLSIQIVTFPILLYHYYEFSLYSILLNLIVVPLMSVILLLAILSILAGSIWSDVGGLVIQGCICILEGYERLCNYILELPYARIVTGQPKLWGIVIYYLCVAVVMWIAHLIKKARGREMVLTGILLLGSVALFVSCPDSSRNDLEITMLDVGQGDCFFIQQDDFTCLIDGGSSSEKQVAKYRIEPFLKYKGVKELDYVFVSHGDADHINGIQEMLERQLEGIRLNTLVMPEQTVWDEALWELARKAKMKGIRVNVIHAGESVMSGDLKIECVYPSDEMKGIAPGNETSLVLDISYLDFDMLFTGDIEKEGEQKLTSMLEKQYDVLKVAHHGSKNSTSEEFLDVVNPEMGVISAGKNNSYGHPHKETLKRLEEEGCKVWNTAESGAVSILVKKEAQCQDTKTVAKLKVFQYNSCYEKFE